MATLAERLTALVAVGGLASCYLGRGREAETAPRCTTKHTTAELTVAAERDRAVEAGHEHARTRAQDAGHAAEP
jgi:hypothetical protein